MRLLNFTFLLLLATTAAWSEQSFSAIDTMGANGWHTWQVDEADATTEMCCFAWKGGSKASGAGCNLDGGHVAYSDDADCGMTPGTLQFYVRFVDGMPGDIRVLSSNCPVTTSSEIIDHGLVSADENIDWFRAIIEDRELDRDTREEALFALVISGSDAAYAYLDRLLASR